MTRRRVLRSSLVFAALFAASTLLCARLAIADESVPTAQWNAFSTSPTRLALDVAEELLSRGAYPLAERKLDEARDALAEEPDAADAERLRYGTLALRSALQSVDVAAPQGRAALAERVDAIRRVAEKGESDFFLDPPSLSEDARNYALALVKTLYEVGTLELLDADRSPSLERAITLSKDMARALPKRDARPYLYWLAKGTLAYPAAPNRLATAEKFVAALEKASESSRDEFWFFSQPLLIAIARESGDYQLASKRVAQALQALKETPDAPREIAVALVSQEALLLEAEGKRDDAILQASKDVDLLASPFVKDLKRWDAIFYNVYDELLFVKASLCWRGVPDAPTKDEKELGAAALDKETLAAEAQSATKALRSNPLRALSGQFAAEAGAQAQDWATLETVAQNLFREEKYDDAIAAYDRAAESAALGSSPDEAYRLRCVAAAVANKAFETDRTPARADNSSRRFLEIARERPAEDSSRVFFLAALERLEELGKSDFPLRYEYLTLFPSAPDRASYAVKLANRAIDEGNFDAARQALDCVDANAPDAELDAALLLERALLAADASPDALCVALARILDKISPATSTSAPSLSALAGRLNKTPSSKTRGEKRTLLAFFSLALEEGACADPLFSKSAKAFLDAENERADDAQDRAQIDALRLSLAISSGDAERVEELTRGSNATETASVATLQGALDLAQKAQGDARLKLAQFVLDTLNARPADFKNHDGTILRANALRLLDRGQESLNLFAAALRERPKDPEVALGIARLLSAQKDEAALRRALPYWSDVAAARASGSKEWWDAKEETFMTYLKLGERDQCEKLLKTLWLTRDDPSDPNRRRRWERALETKP